MKIGIIGLGKLGLPWALLLNEYFDVKGVDLNNETVEKIKKGESPIKEPGVQELLNKKNLFVSSDYSYLQDREIIMIILPTPSQEDGTFNNEYIKNSITEIKKNCTKLELTVINSTVMPNSCESFGLGNICYNPHFIALGSVLQDLKNPDFVLIGESNRRSGDTLEMIYGKIHGKKIYRMSLVSAEISKIALNSYITMKINFANNLSTIAEKYQANQDDIAQAIGSDRRVGHYYLRGGLPYGGPCFPRDNRAFFHLGDSYIPILVDQENRIKQIKRWVNKVKKITKGKICILGKGYKPDTDYLEDSPSIWLKEELEKSGYTVDCIPERDLKDEYDLIILALPSREIIKIPKEKLNTKILDCWRIRPDLKGRNYYT